ncbi:MAG: glycine-rich domain-containing protein, partial [Bacteroidia bacterium]
MFFISGLRSQVTSFTYTPGTGTFTVPCGVTSIAVQCWGGGGAGGGQTNNVSNAGAGGGAGGYSSTTLAVTPGTTLSYTVGAAGAGSTGNGTNGGATTFSTVVANGGTGGGGTGGALGAGGTGTTTNGTSGAVGGATVGGTGGTAGSGGAGGAGGAVGANGTAGATPGGGGGGAGDRSGGSTSGGNGGSGKIIITYTPSATSGCDPCHPISISTSPFTYTGTTVGGFNYMTGGCAGNYSPTSGSGSDVFFAVTVAANSYLTCQLTGTSSANYTELSILSGVCGGPWSCVSNGAWGGGLQTSTSGGVFTTSTPCRTVYFTSAGTYYLRVDASLAAEGPFTLSTSTFTPSANVGDACSNPATLSSGVGTTINNTDCAYTVGTDDPSPASLFCAGTVENTNWLVFTASGTGGAITFNVSSVTCNTGYYTSGPPAGLYSAAGQFGILTSSTNACGGTYSTAVACQSLSTGSTYSGTLTNTAGVNYYFVWDGNGGAECQYTITATNVIPLPVTLVKFDATKNNKQVDLYWKTSSEENCSHFTVQRSLDGANFEDIGFVKAAGNSNVPLEYYFTDESPSMSGVSYYRLKQTDFNGEESVSSMKVVEFEHNSKENFIVYPNPSSKGESTIKTLNFDVAVIEVIIEDYTGKVVYSKTLGVFENEVSIKPEL